MTSNGQLWQYAVVAIAVVASSAGVLAHFFPRVKAGIRRGLARPLAHPAMPTRLQRLARSWAVTSQASCGGCSACAGDAPPALKPVASIAMPVSRRRKS
ncbi:DUF6587 family protein [Bordetella sp. N]|uniref:DUF6587 family protein n=1 Tax=Bordetella sp. N TaxID=1746199 RepID=UPI000709F669|nr:DUF6587 family protein [Bordetella sp. N]ALM85639.1 hypothetical protein ASB57_24160 [Bordetella sp. N]